MAHAQMTLPADGLAEREQIVSVQLEPREQVERPDVMHLEIRSPSAVSASRLP
jgi:hypothetical protein